MSQLVQCNFGSVLGSLRLVANERALCGVYFPEHRPAPRFALERIAPAHGKHAVLDHAARELAAYLRGELRGFDTPLEPEGTEFQRAVWSALCTIPFGETCSYGELARALGRATAVRALGTANGRNPLSIFVPCHRVIGASGELTGYAGGLTAKRWLLDHETRVTGATELRVAAAPSPKYSSIFA